MVPPPLALLPPHATHLAVRWLHLLGMATLLGGAVLAWALFRLDDRPDAAGVGGVAALDAGTSAVALRVATAYEWLFWAGAGLLVLTGVGNLGAMAPAIPDPTTPWGAAFSVKLVGVFGLLLGSLVRTLGVVALSEQSTDGLSSAVLDRLRLGYGATAGYLLVVVLLAEVLAHG